MAAAGKRGLARLGLIVALAVAVPVIPMGGTAAGVLGPEVPAGALVVVDDVAVVAAGQPTTVDVLANDGVGPFALVGTTVPANGTTTVNSDGTVTYAPAAGFAGADAFRYTVRGVGGATGTAAVAVTVANAVPVAVDDEVAVPPGEPVTVSVLANDSDPNSDQVLTVDSVRGPAVVNPDGTVTATGSFTYTVADGAGGTAGASVTVLAADGGPVAADDFAATGYDTPVVVDVRANDSGSGPIEPVTVPVDRDGTARGTVTVDADGRLRYDPPAGFSGVATFGYAFGGGAAAVVTVTVADAPPSAVNDSVLAEPGQPRLIPVLDNDSDPNPGDALRVVGVSGARFGTVVVAVDGSLLYTPHADGGAADSFTYTVSDGNGGTGTATVTVRSANRPPVAVDDRASVRPGATVLVRVLANDTDPDGDPLTVKDVVAGDGDAVVRPDGAVVYTPRAPFSATDTFAYTLDDGNGGTDLATVTVSVLNRAPTAPDGRVTTSAGVPTTVDVLRRVSDPDGDAVALLAVDDPPRGAVAVNLDGSVTYRPDNGFAGTDSFTYTVSDGLGGVARGTVTVVVTNAAPVAVPDTVETAYRTAVSVNVLANDEDRDRDTLRVAALTAPRDRAGTIRGAAEVLANNTVAYYPPAGFSGRVVFTYHASDGFGGTDSAVVTVNVGNAPPSATDNVVRVGTAQPVVVNLLADAVDPNGDRLTVSSLSQPKHGTVVLHANGTVRYQPDVGFRGTDSFTYAVKDAKGALDTGTVTLAVGGSGATAVPVAVADSAVTVVGRPVTLVVLANDRDPDGDVLTVTSVGEATHGDTVVNQDGAVTYIPDRGFLGIDEFSYTIDDGGGRTATATASVIVVAGPIRPTSGEAMTPVIRIGMIAFALGVLLVSVARESIHVRRSATASGPAGPAST